MKQINVFSKEEVVEKVTCKILFYFQICHTFFLENAKKKSFIYLTLKFLYHKVYFVVIIKFKKVCFLKTRNILVPSFNNQIR